MSALRLVVISDVRILREGIAASFVHEGDIRVVAACTSGQRDAGQIIDADPEVLLIDTASGVDLAFVAALRQAVPSAKLVAFGAQETEEEIIAYAEAGYSAYVNRDASIADLVAAIRLARRNELICSSRIAATLFRRIGARPLEPPNRIDALTLRERQVHTLIREGLANKEIATRLSISDATVKNHVHRVLEKLQVRRRAQAARVDQLTPRGVNLRRIS